MIDPNPTTLTILSGATASGTLDLTKLSSRRALTLGISAPATLPEVVNIEVATTATGNFARLESGGDDVDIPADKAIVLTDFPFAHLKLVAQAAAAADRVFDVIGSSRG
jgi:hypothetical protein